MIYPKQDSKRNIIVTFNTQSELYSIIHEKNLPFSKFFDRRKYFQLIFDNSLTKENQFGTYSNIRSYIN